MNQDHNNGFRRFQWFSCIWSRVLLRSSPCTLRSSVIARRTSCSAWWLGKSSWFHGIQSWLYGNQLWFVSPRGQYIIQALVVVKQIKVDFHKANFGFHETNLTFQAIKQNKKYAERSPNCAEYKEKILKELETKYKKIIGIAGSHYCGLGSFFILIKPIIKFKFVLVSCMESIREVIYDDEGIYPTRHC